MYLKTISKYHLRILGILALGIIFYNEFAVYWINYLGWPTLTKIKVDESTGEKSLRFLLVADPQLIGENDEPWYYDWIARWDSDRYLRNTFLLAESYTKPDVIIYLGDLFDEGLKSSDAQFDRYFNRFNSIFRTEKLAKKNGIKHVYISGDNDVGGEYFNDRNDRLGERFEKYFGPMVDVINLNKFTELVKLDLDYTISFYNSVKRNYLLNILNSKERIKEMTTNNNKKFTIILNHMSLLYKNKQEINAVIFYFFKFNY